MAVDLATQTSNATATSRRAIRHKLDKMAGRAEAQPAFAPASSRGSIATPLLSAHATGRVLVRPVRCGGVVPLDEVLHATLIAGQSLAEAAAGTSAAVAIDVLASRLMTELDHVARRLMAPFRPIRRG